VRAVDQGFPVRRFTALALDGYDALPLLQRGRHLARALRATLPDDYDDALARLVATLRDAPVAGTSSGEATATGGPAADDDIPTVPAADGPLASFDFLPHSFFIQDFGLGHVALSLEAMGELTRRFTAEFCIRPFLHAHAAETFARLATWSGDPDEHRRRLVSEGTRPRLPWAIRVPAVIRDPEPGLALLERLRDDPSAYVRRSVANHLNDVGKDHPQRLIEVATRWADGADDARRWILARALRTQVKRGDAAALALLGYGARAKLDVEDVSIRPKRVARDGRVVVSVALRSRSAQPQRLLVDLVVHYARPRGTPHAKTFKLRQLVLAPRATVVIEKRLSLADLSTRRHHPGEHRVELLVNGARHALGSFRLQAH
jgi:3-methyladenine DNA glycosylase AlkC